MVFYDYDEICYMTEVNFAISLSRSTPEQELSGEPQYSVREQDVFPKSLRVLCQDPKVRDYLQMHHQDLFSADYWQKLQNAFWMGMSKMCLLTRKISAFVVIFRTIYGLVD